MRHLLLLALLLAAACGTEEHIIATEPAELRAVAGSPAVDDVGVNSEALALASCGTTARARIKAKMASSYQCNSSWTDVGSQMYNYGGSCKISGYPVKILVTGLVQTGSQCDFGVSRTAPPNTSPVCTWLSGWVLDQSGAVVHLSVVDSTPCT